MNQRDQLQSLRTRLNELRYLLSDEITDSAATVRQYEPEKSSWEYVLRYLDERLESCDTLFAAAVPKSFGQLHRPKSEYRALGYKIVLAAAKCINAPTSGSLTFQDLGQYLSESCLLSTDDSTISIQVAFHIVGWLTGVWDPVWSETSDENSTRAILRIKSCKAPGKRRFYHFDRQAVRRTQITVEEVQNRQICHVMGGDFGNLLPRPEQRPPESRASRAFEVDSENIPKAYFSWQALSQQGYQISWTSTLTEHLQVDQRHRSVLVYQHPSLSWLLYKRKGSNLLTRLFGEEQRQRASHEAKDSDDHHFGIDDFFDDMLRSYRLIFDQASVPWLLSKGRSRPSLPSEDCDPLLRKLCTAGANNAILTSLRDDLEIPAATGASVNLDEYPFLGKRLGVLAKIGKGSQKPNSLWKLWIEKFNVNGLSYRWVLLFLALLALFFQAVQTIVSMWPMAGK